MRIQALFVIVLGCAAALAQATDFYYEQSTYHGQFGARVYYENELARLRRDFKTQRQIELRNDERLQQTLSDLRRSLDHQNQITAEQACCYRMTGGLETCDDMFVDGTESKAACEQSVRRRNPGCAG